MSDNNLHCEKMQAAELERLIRTPSADSQSAEGNSTAYYQTQQKSPRSWTCTATFYAMPRVVHGLNRRNMRRAKLLPLDMI
jgi:hypothetical protein